MRLAVILPIYNAKDTLKACLDSLFVQTFTDFCVLAINDGSTDNSADILEDYAKHEPRLRVYHFDQNQGDPVATQFAMSLTNYMNIDYVARMDADDVCLPERFEKQVAFLDAHTDIGVLGANMFCFFDGQTDGHYITNAPLTDASIKVNFCQAGANILNPTSMYRQSSIKVLNINYNQGLTACDFGMWIDCAIKGVKFANLPDVLVKYRLHANQASRKLELINASVQIFLERYLRVLFPNLNKEQVSALTSISHGQGVVSLTMAQVDLAFESYEKIKTETQSVLGEDKEGVLCYLARRIELINEVLQKTNQNV